MSNNDNMSELPKSWKWTTLGEIVTSIKGKKPARSGMKSNYFTIPYINIQAFERKVFTQFTDDNGCPTCKQDDVLIVWDGARFGLVGKGVAGVIGSTLAKLVCNEIDSGYLFHFLQAQFEIINSSPRGVGIPHIEPTIFWNIAFPLPPLPEQQRIVAKIEELFSRLDAGVEALNKIKAQLKRYRQAVLKYAFEGKLTAEWREAQKSELEPATVLLEKIKQERKKTAKGKFKELPQVDTSDLPELPEGWVWTRVGEVSLIVTKGSTPTSYGFNYTPSGINFIKVENLKDGIIEKDSLSEFITANIHDFLKRSQLWEDDVLFSIAGTIGRVAIVHIDDLPANTNQAIALIRCPWQFIAPTYIRNVLESSIARSSIEKRPRGIGMKNVSLGDVENIVFPLPPLPEQQKIVEEIERHFSIADQTEKTIEQSLKQAERLRRSILKRAFEGKLVPQDLGDEPAEKLLARIRIEKAKREAEKKASRGKKRVDTRQRSLR